MRSSISPIKALNAAIAGQNPFDRVMTLKDSEIWGHGFIDVKTLNNHASEAIFQALETAQTSSTKIQVMAVVGELGTGKTHLLHRLRRQLQMQGSGLFIYVNVSQFQDVNLVRYHFLQTVVDSLRRSGSFGVLQCQQLATEMVNEALKILTPNFKPFTPLELIKKLAGNSHSKNHAWVNQLSEAFFKTQPDIPEPDIVRALIWTLCNAQAPFAIKWLAGRTLATWKADELGLPNHNAEDRESMAWETVRQLLQLLNHYCSVIICFDELDSSENSDNNLKRERVVASLVKRLCDTLQLNRFSYGGVIVSVMTPTTWNDKIKTLPVGVAACITGQKEPIVLHPLISDQIVDFITIALQNFYAEQRLFPPTPIYPFDIDQLNALGREKLTVRQVLEWCHQNFYPVELDPLEKVEQAFEAALTESWEKYWDNNYILSEAIQFAFQTLVGQIVEDLTIEAIESEVKPKAANQNYIQFKILATYKGKILKIGVAVLQDHQGQKVTAGLKRLVQYQQFDLTTGCLVRDPAKNIPEHWQAAHYLQQLLTDLQGKWVFLMPQDIQPLLAIWSVYQTRQIQGLSDTEIFDFISQRKLTIENGLIREILRNSIDQTQEKPAVSQEDHSQQGFSENSSNQRDLMRDLM